MRLVLSLSGLLLLSASANAVEIVVPSKVEAVTVFLSGAEVTRQDNMRALWAAAGLQSVETRMSSQSNSRIA